MAAEPLDSKWDEEWQEFVFKAAMQRLRNHRVDAKNIQIFDWSVRRGLPVAQVARDLHVSRARVYLARQRVGRLLKREIAELRERVE